VPSSLPLSLSIAYLFHIYPKKKKKDSGQASAFPSLSLSLSFHHSLLYSVAHPPIHSSRLRFKEPVRDTFALIAMVCWTQVQSTEYFRLDETELWL
jgi:hypothetical protein